MDWTLQKKKKMFRLGPARNKYFNLSLAQPEKNAIQAGPDRSDPTRKLFF